MTLKAPAWALAALAEARIGHLSTADREATPLVVPVCFVFDGELLWSPIDAKPKSTRRLRRVRNLEANPRAALLVDHYEEDWRRLWWVLVHCRGEVTQRAAGEVFDRLREKYPQYHEVEPGPELLRLTPQRLSCWRYGPDSG